MLEVFYFAVSLLGLCFAAYTDLRERIVPNRLVFALGATGLAGKAFESLSAGSAAPMVLALEGGAVAFILGYVLYRLGIWAGGDVKLLTAVSLLNPVNYVVLGKALGAGTGIFAPTGLPFFSVSLVVYSALAVFPLGIMMSFGALVKNRKALSEAMSEAASKLEYVLLAGAIAAGLKVCLDRIDVNALFSVPLLLLLAVQRRKRLRLAAIVVSLAGALVSAWDFVVYAFWIAVPSGTVYAFFVAYARSRQLAFRETVQTCMVEEGMVPDRYVVERDGAIVLVPAPGIRKVIKQLIGNRTEKGAPALVPEGRVIASPGDAGGLTEEAARELREKAGAGMAPGEMVVRKTMAFVPAMLVAFVLLQLTGDLIWNVVLR